jgi:hypothetical protein
MWKNVKWVLRQLALTLYDDFEFKHISLPRVWCAVSGLCIIVALIAELGFGIKFSGWTQLVAWASTCLTAYVGKKFSERGKDNEP